MTVGYEDPTRESTLAEIARRRGTPAEWGDATGRVTAEPVQVIKQRIHEHLDTQNNPLSEDDRRLTNVMVLAEHHRQQDVIRAWIISEMQEKQFMHTWEPVARLLVAAVKHPSDPRSDGEVVGKVLAALRLVDQHINNRTRWCDPARPIG